MMNLHIHPARWPDKEIFCKRGEYDGASWISIGQFGEWSVTLFARDGLTARDIADALADALRQFERDEHAESLQQLATPWPPQLIPADAANRPLTGAEVSRALGEQP